MTEPAAIIPTKFYRCKLTYYSKHLAECVFWYDEPLGREGRREAQLYPNRQIDKDQKDPESNLARAFRRAKSKCRKLVLSMVADRILTLTFRENITDRELSDRFFVRFIKLVHEKYPKFQYVAVAEKQKRGAWHYHLAVAGWQDVGFLRSTWRSLVDGNIDVTTPRTQGNQKQGAAYVAAYLTKYMTKAFVELHQVGRYRYRASNGITPKQAVFWLQARNYYQAQREAVDLLEELIQPVGSYYFSDDWSCGWLATWSLRPSPPS